MEKITRVVFVAFIQNGKLLVCKSVRSAKQNLYTLVGGTLLEDESVFEGAIRECKEEINPDFDLRQRDLEELFIFVEPAASDPELIIEITVMLSHKEIDVELLTNLEILEHKWYSIHDQEVNLSTTITEYFLPWAIINKKIY